MSLKGKISAGFDFTETLAPSTPESVKRAIKSLITETTINDGTGTNAATIIWNVRATLAATTATYDLTSLAVPNVAGSGTGSPIVTFAKIKGLFVYSESTTDGQILLVGNAASNAWSAFTDTAAAKLNVMPSSPLILTNLYAQGSNPWTVDSTHKNLKFDSGAATITFNVIIIGV